ncbi:DUF2087 domain-containing protein [Halocynthiibacter styelae]|uniref:DUF2087 domain-containing protein n=1 Tax=Halocynthiibacter styelae TaxID=2761955 RepID=A0A8J7LKD2_9RHOB|nr:DUF2087 domain-containing protein [Paenihalocynthiibacter styelae]MBI1492369.1 DUF2087 domain-containing protein [Paenihalocynthiibacter styelae]
MSRDTTSLYIEDLSHFAKSLRAGLTARDETPGHLALLGLIAKSAGHANYQSLKTRALRPDDTKQHSTQMKRALRVFDDQGVMIRWPKQTQVQGLCLWVFWADLPPGRAITEQDVNEILKEHSSFGDHVLMRRSLIDHGLARREIDGRAYYRIEQEPHDEALLLIREIRGRR